MAVEIGPTRQKERIVSLDVLRGFAVLGILIMNIQNFSMIGAAYFNPTAYGDLSGLNYGVWLLSHLLADMKFLTIFSMLFGAGIVLMAERMEGRGQPPTSLHYRRMAILLLVGLAHGWLLWSGDILYAYAMCGFLVFLARKKKPRTLMVLGLLATAVASVWALFSQFSMPYWPEEAVAGMAEFWAPASHQVLAEVEAYRGGWMEQNAVRMPTAFMMETMVFLTNMGWRAGGMMLVGMGLYKLGVFGAGFPARVYRRMIAAALFVGLPLILGGVWYQEATRWRLETGFFGGTQFNYWGSILVALGWIGVVMLFYRRWKDSRLSRALAATGQMAFTNYILQTLICTTLFFGHGFGLYGSVERTGQILIVLAIWAFQLLLSPWWLARFRYGPLEWAWRSLSYGTRQPFRRAPRPGPPSSHVQNPVGAGG